MQGTAAGGAGPCAPLWPGAPPPPRPRIDPRPPRLRARRRFRVSRGPRPNLAHNRRVRLVQGLGGCLVGILAEVRDDALRARRNARDANVTSMQKEPMVGVLQVFLRSGGYEFILDVARRFAGRQ